MSHTKKKSPAKIKMVNAGKLIIEEILRRPEEGLATF